MWPPTSRPSYLFAISVIEWRMAIGGTVRRWWCDVVGDMARNVQVINLNHRQDLDGPLMVLIDAIVPEPDWELLEAIPLLRESLDEDDIATMFYSARYAIQHVPTRLNVKGPRWYESANRLRHSHVCLLYTSPSPRDR